MTHKIVSHQSQIVSHQSQIPTLQKKLLNWQILFIFVLQFSLIKLFSRRNAKF